MRFWQKSSSLGGNRWCWKRWCWSWRRQNTLAPPNGDIIDEISRNYKTWVKINKNAFQAKIPVIWGKSAMLKTTVMVLTTPEHVYATKWRRLWGPTVPVSKNGSTIPFKLNILYCRIVGDVGSNAFIFKGVRTRLRHPVVEVSRIWCVFSDSNQKMMPKVTKL